MNHAYRIVNTLIDDLRRVDAPAIPKLKVEIQLIRIKRILLVLDARNESPAGLQALLYDLRSAFESNLGYMQGFVSVVTEIAEQIARLAHITNGLGADRRKGIGGPNLMRRKEDHL